MRLSQQTYHRMLVRKYYGSLLLRFGWNRVKRHMTLIKKIVWSRRGFEILKNLYH